MAVPTGGSIAEERCEPNLGFVC